MFYNYQRLSDVYHNIKKQVIKFGICINEFELMDIEEVYDNSVFNLSNPLIKEREDYKNLKVYELTFKATQNSLQHNILYKQTGELAIQLCNDIEETAFWANLEVVNEFRINNIKYEDDSDTYTYVKEFLSFDICTEDEIYNLEENSRHEIYFMGVIKGISQGIKIDKNKFLQEGVLFRNKYITDVRSIEEPSVIDGYLYDKCIMLRYGGEEMLFSKLLRIVSKTT